MGLRSRQHLPEWPSAQSRWTTGHRRALWPFSTPLQRTLALTLVQLWMQKGWLTWPLSYKSWVSEINLCGVGKYSGSGVYVFLHPPYSVCIYWTMGGNMKALVMRIVYFSQVIVRKSFYRMMWLYIKDAGVHVKGCQHCSPHKSP